MEIAKCKMQIFIFHFSFFIFHFSFFILQLSLEFGVPTSTGTSQIGMEIYPTWLPNHAGRFSHIPVPFRV
jgi:hypothetical protein